MSFNRLKIIIFSLVFILTSSMATNALEYQDWTPLLPAKIGELDKSGEPTGMNKEESGKAWSALEQQYSDSQGNEIKLRILSGPTAPGVQEFKSLQEVSLKNSEREVKTLEIYGYRAVLVLNKKKEKNNLLISPCDETIVIISTSSFDNEEDITSLA
ncbi:MAG: hypothetical protein R6U97_11780, partial [Desulfosalsimonas sp.]